MPQVVMEMTTLAKLDILQDATTAVTGTLLATAVVELFSAPDEFQPAAVIGDYTLAAYDGYGAEAVTWSAATISDDGQVEVVGVVGEFRPASATGAEVITGFLLRNAGGDILGGGTFDPGLPMGATTDQILVVPRVRFPIVGVLDYVS